MKSHLMRIPCVNQIYYQKFNQEKHRKKLLQIRQTRKNHLCSGQLQDAKITTFKENKANAFIKQLNTQSQNIIKNNMFLLNRLTNAKPTFHTFDKQKDKKRLTHSFSNNPYKKKLANEHEKQNRRVSERIKTMASFLKGDKLNQQYQRTQQIKKRILRFAQDLENKKISLKSEKYVQQLTEKRAKTKMSQGLSVLNSAKNSTKPSYSSFSHHVSGYKSYSHYKADQIRKNRIESPSSFKIFKVKRSIANKIQNKDKANTCALSQLINNTSKIPLQRQSFFATEPIKE